jgi:tRNA-specific 2-thiouridylase
MVAMSGGVDSSVAAALLQEQGYTVVGATMKLLDSRTGETPILPEERTCCSLDAVRRAQAVCRQLEIPHYTLNFVQVFREAVMEPFVREYAEGRTPNPCLSCNLLVKWGELLRRARGVGCDYLATGHYARVERSAGREGIYPLRRHLLRRGIDPDKDQSYALYGLSQEALAVTLLPLGALTKEEVRAHAAKLELPTAETPESQDICFIPEGNYRGFLRDRIPFAPGPIVDQSGRVLGEHEGLPAYTVGQRRGLPGGMNERLFVLAKRRADNCLLVGPREALARREALLEAVNWVSREPLPPGETLAAQVELRYRGEPVGARVTALPQARARLELDPHTQAVTPGQAAVFYDGDLLLGGGTISEEAP